VIRIRARQARATRQEKDDFLAFTRFHDAATTANRGDIAAAI
jgi:hypothetical protein